MTLPWLPPVESAEGTLVDRVLVAIHLLIAIIFVGWGAWYLWAVARRPAAVPDAPLRRLPRGLIGALAGGIALAEAILFLGVELPAWHRLRVAVPTGPDVVPVHVVAEQFAWNVHYPGPDGRYGRTDLEFVSATNPVGLDTTDTASDDDAVVLNQLHLPVNRTAVIELSSKDVIHSFSIPVMRVKQDVIPGQRARVWFTPIVEGSSDLGCAQLCGLGHYRMKGEVTIESQAAFDAWLREHRRVMR